VASAFVAVGVGSIVFPWSGVALADFPATGPKVPMGVSVCRDVGRPGDVLLANATITEPDRAGFATVGPTGAAWQTYSTNNYAANDTLPNLTLTSIGGDGRVCATPSQPAHEILDAIGFLAAAAFSSFANSPTPTRILDTRLDSSPTRGARVDAGSPVCVTVGHPGEVLVANATVTGPVAAGFATVGSSAAAWQSYSTNNFAAGRTLPNLTVTVIGADGQVCVTSSQPAHVILDAVGFIDPDVFAAFGPSGVPRRILDTRVLGDVTAGAAPAGGSPVCVHVGHPGEVLLANATVTEPDRAGFATVGQTGAAWQTYSTNNFAAGDTLANLTVTVIGPDGAICMTPSQRAHLVIDAIGFLPSTTFTPYGGSTTPTRILDTRRPADGANISIESLRSFFGEFNDSNVGEHTVGVYLCEVPVGSTGYAGSNGRLPLSVDALAQFGQASVAEELRRASNGALLVEFVPALTFTLGMRESPYDCANRATAHASGRYWKAVAIDNSDRGDGFGGWLTAWIGGASNAFTGYWVHELGHTFGWDHSYIGGAGTPTAGFPDEYDNPVDVMSKAGTGYSGSLHVLQYHAFEEGWLRDGEAVAYFETSPASYQIVPTGAAGLKLVLIPDLASRGIAITLEAVQGFGYEGVAVHLVESGYGHRVRQAFGRPYTIDHVIGNGETLRFHGLAVSVTKEAGGRFATTVSGSFQSPSESFLTCCEVLPRG